MSLISKDIPSLANGVSQQPPSARLSSQGEEQLNGYSSIVEGNGKRSPTHHVAKIIDGSVGDVTLHLINRDTEERYDVVIANNSIQVFDLDGDEKTVARNQPTDGYLDAVDPKTAFRAVTVADYTILVNTEKVVEMKPRGGSATLIIQTSPAPVTGDVYDVVVSKNNVDFASQYTVTAGQTATQVATGIKAAMDAVVGFTTDFTVTQTGAELDINRDSSLFEAFDITVHINGVFLPAAFVDNETDDPFATGVTELKVFEPFATQGFFFVKQGNYGTNYRIEVQDGIRGFFAEKTTSNTVVTDIDTKKIASDLYNTIIAVTNFTTDYTATLSGNLIKIEKISPLHTAFVMKAEDGNGNRNIVAVKGSLQKFTDLPATCFNDFRVKIIGDEASDEDDYYVQFVAPSGFTPNEAIQGVWDEVERVGEPKELEPSLMPHTLVRQADGSFIFGQQEWDQRAAGDGDSNAEPTIVGKQINDIVFFRNRLGFLADENVIQSAAGGPGYFRFWRQTVTAVLDGDPIDVSASNVSVSILRNAVPYSKNDMLLFSDQKQFIYSGGDLLTPKTASIKPSTSYEATPGCKPVAVGKAIYFPTPQGDNSGLREFTTDDTTAVDDAQDITAHVPSYIPANIFKIAAAPNESLMCILTRDDPNSIYVYKFYFVGNDKLQASWSRWPMGGEVMDANFLGSTLHLSIQREDGVYLERLNVEAFRNDDNMEYEIMLDRRFLAGPGGIATGVYAANTNLTTFTLPYETDDIVQAVVRDNGSIPAGFYESQILSCTKLAGNTSITIAGDVSAVPLVIGVSYSFEYTLSEIVPKQAAGQGGERPMTGGRLQLRYINLVFDRTGYFRVEVTPLYGTTFSYHYAPRTLGSYEAGTYELGSGEFKFPVAAKSDEVLIKIINDSPYPSRFLNATWEGEFILKTRRM